MAITGVDGSITRMRSEEWLVAVGTLAIVQDQVRGRIEPTTSAAAEADRTVLEVEAVHGQAIFGFVRRQGLSDDEAQDAVQETLLRLWEALSVRGQEIDNPRGWAYRAAYRLAMDRHRLGRRLRLIALRLDGERTAATDPAQSLGDRVSVWAEVDRLPLRQRQVLYLRYRSDLAFGDVGDVLGISASAARSHATQALAVLRQRLGAEEIG